MEPNREISLLDYKIFIKEIKSPEEGDISEQNYNSFEISQRGDLRFGQDISEMSEGSQNDQNNNILSYRKNLIPIDREENKCEQEYPSDNQNIQQDNNNKVLEDYEIINKKYAILKDLKIIAKININDKNEFKYEKIIYYEGKKEEQKIVREITYKQLKDLSEKELGQKYDFEKYTYILENLKKIIGFLNKIEEISNTFVLNIRLGEKLSIDINLEEDSNKNNNENIKMINSEYTIDSKNFKIRQYQDKNILKNCNYENFKSFLDEIKKKLEPPNNNINDSTNFSSNYPEQISKYGLISFIKIIGKHKGIAQKIMEIKDNIISGGNDGIIQYKIDSKEEHFYKNYCSFFIAKNKVFISLKNRFISLNNDTSVSKINAINSWSNLFTLKNNDCMICNNNGIYYISDFFDTALGNQNPSKLYEKTYKGGIKINDYIIAFTSNRILSNGENKLIFFNSKTKKFLEEIEISNYSFTLSENNCSIMKIPNNKNSILLFAACKKYNEGDKNGILLIKLQFFDFETKKSQIFYDTENFEVFCFSPILEINNKDFLNNPQISETEYLLVGGFDTVKREGLIKLYKVIYYDEIEKIEIEFIQDIIIEKFKGFKGPISCIFQSPQKGVFVTCYDGNVYLFSQPNVEKIREIENKSILKL